ncbi:MAG: DUF507 family protein [Deltaproteobacteria bacterium]|nr:MAG: DUF507 family protein [Deltaproteobacteria bacterium]
MKLSEDRISHIAHMIFDRLYDDDVVDFDDEEEGLREIKRAMVDFFKYYDEIDATCRRKIESLRKKVPEGSPEWEILYRKFFEDELSRRRIK